MPQLYRYIVGIAITSIVLFLVWYFSNVVTFVLIAAVLAIIGKPLTDLLCGLHIRKTRFPKWLAALITLITIWIILISVFWLFIPILFQKANELSSLNFNEIINSFQQPINDLEHFIEKTFSINAQNFSIMDAISKQMAPLLNVNLINKLVSSIVVTIGNFAVAAFSISFITFFFLKESTLFFDMVVIMFPKKYEQNISRAMDSITKLLVRYFTGIVMESTIMLIMVSVGLLIWGFSIHNALVIALIVSILNVIPYIGPMIGLAIGIFIGVMGTGDASFVRTILEISSTIVFAQIVDNLILQPILYSNSAKAHPLEIFLVILIAGSLAGVLGMLLAIPSYNVIRVFAKEFFNNFRVVQKLTEKI